MHCWGPLALHNLSKCRDCRLVNKSGLRLSYWVDGPAGRSEAFSVNSWEEGPLHVEPVEKTVVLPDTQLQVKAAKRLKDS